MTEAQIQKQIMSYLQVRGIYHWRQNSGALRVPAGEGRAKAGFYRFASINGISDILGILPDGRLLAIEVKKPGNKPTEDQSAFMESINQRGGLAFVARSIEDVAAALKQGGY